MKNPGLTQLLVFLATFAILTSCGGGSGGGGVAGIGGTGISSTGTVTGFGSVFVNGVEYETGAATFTVDGETFDAGTVADDSVFDVGMVVQITGTLDDGGTSGVADSVVYDDEVEGPIENAPVADPDGVTKTFTILGISVSVDKTTTVFDDEDSTFSFDTIAQDDFVEISGFFDPANATLRATRVERKDPLSVDADDVEAKGTIGSLDSNLGTFVLTTTLGNTINVSFNSGTDTTDLPNGIVEGEFVEVEGALEADDSITATKIEAENELDFDENEDQVSLEGIISDFVSQSDFKVDGQPVDASAAELEPATLILADGISVEVEGPIENGVLNAEKVEGRGGDIEIEAFVSSVDTTAGTVTLQLTATPENQFITVFVDSQTILEDERDDSTSFALADIVATDFLDVEAAQDSGGNVVATHIKRDDAGDDVILRGPVSLNLADSTVTILGAKFGTDINTDFERDDTPIDSTDFFVEENNGAIVKVKDVIEVEGDLTGDGTADEVEIED